MDLLAHVSSSSSMAQRRKLSNRFPYQSFVPLAPELLATPDSERRDCRHDRLVTPSTATQAESHRFHIGLSQLSTMRLEAAVDSRLQNQHFVIDHAVVNADIKPEMVEI